ncbi:molybdenum cofactor guanylyltransferase [Sphingosinicella sp. YJ22]|uniref:molybdenum cofactor guanylyltransferase n=1 Tax=Sphingosinicella sp. YJ22 TaxID=1104780 RepID=UPI00140D01A2|nr:molybdenum cofactor guanylyltransferase [Sphingosinicella sp. YJ22]
MTAPLVVILAGGEGQRMGGAKPLRMLHGERLVDRALRKARAWSDDVRVALRDRRQIEGVDVPVLLDDPAIEGPLAGLRSALTAAREAGREMVLTIPCDAPFVPGDLAAALEAAIGTNGVALARSAPDLHPTCAMWRTETLDLLPDYVASGRRSLIGFAELAGYAAVDWDSRRFFNLNRPEDLAEAERRLASEVEDVDPASGFDRGPPGH